MLTKVNKLQEYRDKEGKAYSDKYNFENGLWEDGFDAAIRLDLPIKFSLWRQTLSEYEIIKIIGEGQYYHEKDQEWLEKELYQYWLDNILMGINLITQSKQ